MWGQSNEGATTTRETRTKCFFEEWHRATGGLSLELKGAYAEIAAMVVMSGECVEDHIIPKHLGINARKWKRLKEELMLAGAIVIRESDGAVMVKALKGRLYKTGYSYAKAHIPAALRWQVFQRDHYQCVECGAREDLTADHILAEIHGGETVLANLQTLCRPCNGRKGARQ